MTEIIGIISNPRSRRNRKAAHAFEVLIGNHPEVRHRAFHEVSEVPECLRELAAEGVTHLIISGGDGTVQAVITELINGKPFPDHPKLSLIPSGMTNAIARDLGSTERPMRLLKRMIARISAGDPGERLERTVMTLDLGDDGPVIHGFLLGAIAFYEGTMLARRKVYRLGIHQSLGSKLSLLLSVLRVICYGPGERSGFGGERVTAVVDGRGGAPQELFLLVATTLSQVLPGIRPFWGTGPGRMKLTTITHPPRRFALAVLPALWGRPRPWMERLGYCSRRVERLECDLGSRVVFDGEILETDSGPGFRLSVGPTVAFQCF
ncbi:MAG TPA: diacylglycerol kinase family protein [Candidatus Cybelea sp.]|nr:diacylglycerol kinase family protein [Candidatus Cybelea sp.]